MSITRRYLSKFDRIENPLKLQKNQKISQDFPVNYGGKTERFQRRWRSLQQGRRWRFGHGSNKRKRGDSIEGIGHLDIKKGVLFILHSTTSLQIAQLRPAPNLCANPRYAQSGENGDYRFGASLIDAPLALTAAFFKQVVDTDEIY